MIPYCLSCLSANGTLNTEFIHSSVRYIEMSNTHLQSVDDETFQGLRLKTLKLIDNELQDISERSFRNFVSYIASLKCSLTQNLQKPHLQIVVLTSFNSFGEYPYAYLESNATFLLLIQYHSGYKCPLFSLKHTHQVIFNEDKKETLINFDYHQNAFYRQTEFRA
uniref:Uncharacterized protein n=1 Tax=Glossina brevipalpis TaxID=37001 RepID=A0A1A9WZG2_9MUSC